MTLRSVVLDVGETLIDETRVFTRWADRLGVPHLTFLGIIGAMAATGRPLLDAFRVVRPGFDLAAELAAWRAEEPDSLRENFDAADLYPDVRASLAELRALGLRVIVAGNQPVQAGPALAAMDLPVDAIHTSAAWGARKPEPEFFALVQETAGCDPAEILYVGDRVDNDVRPAKEAGMRAALLRRGPWGYLHVEWPEAEQADIILDSLTQLPEWVRTRPAGRRRTDTNG